MSTIFPCSSFRSWTTFKILRAQIITVEGLLGNNGRAPAGSGRHAAANSGSYNVRTNEMPRDKQERKMRCLVVFLDDTEEIFEVEVSEHNHIHCHRMCMWAQDLGINTCMQEFLFISGVCSNFFLKIWL